MGGVMSHRLTFRRFRLPLRLPVRTAHGVWAERDGVMVRLEDSDGRMGFGEAAVIPWFGTETAEAAEAACRKLGEQVDEARLASVPTRLGCLRNALAAARGEIAAGAEAALGAERGAVPALTRRATLGVAALLP